MRVLALIAFALVGGFAASAPVSADALVVAIDHSVRLPVQGQAANVVVGNPKVADVTVVDSRTLFVSGRAFGQTDVVVLDNLGRTIFSGDVIVGASREGRVSVYRGHDRIDLNCDPGCAVPTAVGDGKTGP
jgi:Flp pilus assembly secretin CpaC